MKSISVENPASLTPTHSKVYVPTSLSVPNPYKVPLEKFFEINVGSTEVPACLKYM